MTYTTSAGKTTEIQYNKNKINKGDSNLTWEDTNQLLSIGNTNDNGSIKLGTDKLEISHNGTLGNITSSGLLAISSGDNNVQVESIVFNVGAVSGVTTLDMSGNLNIDGFIVLNETINSNTVSMSTYSYISENYTISVPVNSGNPGQNLTNKLSGNLSWDNKYSYLYSGLDDEAFIKRGQIYPQTLNESIGCVAWSPSLNLYIALSPFTSYALKSSDGVFWEETTGYPARRNWVSILWAPEADNGNGRFVAVGYNSDSLSYSSDGETWIDVTGGPALQDITWSPELSIFVVCGPSSSEGIGVASDSDLSVWTYYDTAPDSFSSLVWGAEAGKFVAVRSNTSNSFNYSSDGVTWSKVGVSGIVNRTWKTIAWSSELIMYVCVSQNYIIRSSNGINWSEVNVVGNWEDIIWISELNIFVVSGGTSSKCIYSKDGIIWNDIQVYSSGKEWNKIAYSDLLKKVIIFNTDNTGSERVLEIGPGISKISTKKEFQIPSLILDDKSESYTFSIKSPMLTEDILLYLPDNKGVLGYSLITDGVGNLSWSQSNYFQESDYLIENTGYSPNPLSFPITNFTFRKIAWSPKLKLFVSLDNSNVLYSSDGNTWLKSTISSGQWNDIIWAPEADNNNGRFVAVGGVSSDLEFAYSTDGIVWNKTIQIGIGGGGSIIWSPENNRYVIGPFVTKTGFVTVDDSDLNTFTNRTIPINNRTWGIVWAPEADNFQGGNGIFVAISDSYDNVMYSLDGISWSNTGVDSPSGSWSKSIAWSPTLNLFLSIETNNILTSTDGKIWSITSNITGNWTNVVWIDELELFLISGGLGANCIYSIDGTNWNNISVSDTSKNWGKIVYSHYLKKIVISTYTDDTSGIPLMNINSYSTSIKSPFNIEMNSLILTDSVDQSNNITIKVPNITTDYSLTLPINTGTVNQVLSTDGSGDLSWKTDDLQNSYDVSVNPEIIVNDTKDGLIIKDNSTPITGDLFSVTDNSGSTEYLNVSSSGVTVTSITDSTATLSGGDLSGITTLGMSGDLTIGGNITRTSGLLTISSSDNNVQVEDVIFSSGDINGVNALSQSQTTPTIRNVNISGIDYADVNVIKVKGDYAFVATKGAFLNEFIYIIYISDPDNIYLLRGNQQANSIPTLNGVEDIIIYGSYVILACSGSNSILIFDFFLNLVSTYTNNTELGGVNSIYLSGNRMYCTSPVDDSISIIDISNIYSLTLLGTYKDIAELQGPNKIIIKGEIAYVSGSTGNSFVSLDVSNSSNPTFSKKFTINSPTTFDIQGNQVYVYSSVDKSIICLTLDLNPASELDTYTDLINLDDISTIKIFGKYIYLVSPSLDTLTVLNTGNGSNITPQTSLTHSNLDGILNFDISGRFLYFIGAVRIGVINLKGSDLISANIGNIKTGSLDVMNDSYFGGYSSFLNGINIGGSVGAESIGMSGDLTIGGNITRTSGLLTISSTDNNVQIEDVTIAGDAVSGVSTLGMSGDLTIGGDITKTTGLLTISSTDNNVQVEDVIFDGDAVSGVSTLGMSGDLTIGGDITKTTGLLTISSTDNNVQVEDVIFNGAEVSGVSTLGMSGDLTIGGDITKTTGLLIISSTDNNVQVEDVIFNGQNIANIDNINMDGNLTNSNNILLDKASDSNITKSGGGDLNITNSVGDVNIELVNFGGQNISNVDNINMSGNLTNSNDILLDKASDSNITKSGGGDLNITNSVGNVTIEDVVFANRAVSNITTLGVNSLTSSGDVSIGGILDMYEDSIRFTDTVNQSITKTGGDLSIISDDGNVVVEDFTFNAKNISTVGSMEISATSGGSLFLSAPVNVVLGATATTEYDISLTKAGDQSINKSNSGDLIVSSVGEVNVFASGNVSGARDVIIEARGADATTYLGATTVDTFVRIGNGLVNSNLVIGTNQNSGTINIGSASNRTGHIQIGGPLSNFDFNTRAGTMNLQTLSGNLDISSSANINISSVGEVNVFASGNVLGDRDVIIEARGADATTYLGATTVDTFVRIGNGLVNSNLVIGTSQTSGTINIGGAASRSGYINIGSGSANFDFNTRAGTMNLQTIVGDLDITSSSANININSNGNAIINSTNGFVQVEDVTFSSGLISRDSGNIVIQVDNSYSATIEEVIFANRAVSNITTLGVNSLTSSGDVSIGGILDMYEDSIIFTYTGNQSITKTGGLLIISSTDNVQVEDVIFDGAAVGGVSTLGMSGDLTIGGDITKTTGLLTISSDGNVIINSINGFVQVENVKFSSGLISRDSGNIVIQVDPGYSVTIEDVIFDDRTLTNVDNIDMIGNLTNSNADIVFNKGSTQSITKSGGGDLNISSSVGDVIITASANDIILNGSVKVDTSGIEAINPTADLKIGTLQTSGRITLGDSANHTGYVKIHTGIDSTAANNGSLVLNGGLGVGKKLYVGTSIDVPTIFTDNVNMIGNLTNTKNGDQNITKIGSGNLNISNDVGNTNIENVTFNSAAVSGVSTLNTSSLVTSGGGVRFGSGNTTLNYYQEGAFNPTLSTSGNSDVSGQTKVGSYTRIGNVVYISGRITYTGDPSNSGDAEIHDLPFNCSDSNGTLLIGQCNGLDTVSWNINLITKSGTNKLAFVRNGNDSTVLLPSSDLLVDSYMTFSGCYFA
jgi:hypothetical protein